MKFAVVLSRSSKNFMRNSQTEATKQAERARCFFWLALPVSFSGTAPAHENNFATFATKGCL